MLEDGVAYASTETIYDELRPLAVRWIRANDGPGAITEIPNGWKLDPHLKCQQRVSD